MQIKSTPKNEVLINEVAEPLLAGSQRGTLGLDGAAESTIIREPLKWRQVAEIAAGGHVLLSAETRAKILHSREIVDSIILKNIRAYGVNSGVGALSDTVVDSSSQRLLSRNLLMSHACGVGDDLAPECVRAIITALINGLSRGYSGIRLETVDALITLLNADVIPCVPSRGSAGYLMHSAHIGLVLIGKGEAFVSGERLSGAEALKRVHLSPLTLEAKEGLSLINGTPCATGLAVIALSRTERLLDWIDAISALTLEALGAQMAAFDDYVLSMHASPHIREVARRIRGRLHGSAYIATASGSRTQDALSLRAIPHVHGAARGVFQSTQMIVDQELASVTDNPIVFGTKEDPRVASEAHAVAPALGQSLDSLAVSIAQIAAMSERRLDRLLISNISGLPPFLAANPGVGTGFMIAQYTAAALVSDNRRLSLPASLDGGITSGLQEDFLAHSTAAATKLLKIIENAAIVVSIELLAATEAIDFLGGTSQQARSTAAVHEQVRSMVPRYYDDRPLSMDIQLTKRLIFSQIPSG